MNLRFEKEHFQKFDYTKKLLNSIESRRIKI